MIDNIFGQHKKKSKMVMSKAIKKRKKPRTEVIMGISGVGTWGGKGTIIFRIGCGGKWQR